VVFTEGPPLLGEETLSLQGGAAYLFSLELAGVYFTHGAASFGIKLLAVQDAVADRALEALRMEVFIERLHPAVPGLDWEATTSALGGEQFFPVVLAIWHPVLEEEGRVAK